MDITDWQIWLDLFSTSARRPGVFSQLYWSPYALIKSTPLLLGPIVFALTFVRPRSWVALPRGSARIKLLSRLGSFGSLGLLLVALGCSTLVALFPGLTTSSFVSGAWFRAAAPCALVVFLGVSSLGLSREPQPEVGRRAILPRRPWHTFTSKPILSIIFVLATLYVASELWQAVAGSEPRELHSIFGGDRLLRNSSGAPPTAMGWENHVASLAGLLLALGLLVWTLSRDASRPVSNRKPFTEVKLERAATAQLICLVSLGGAMLALGTAWIHTWAPATAYVPVTGGLTGEDGDMLMSHYHGLVAVLRALGWLIQGLGAGLLMRLGLDTMRAGTAARSTGHTAADPGLRQELENQGAGGSQ